MKKPEKSIKKRKAAAKRGEKRSLRLKATAKDKSERKASVAAAKKKADLKLKKYMDSLLQGQGQTKMKSF